MYWNDLSPRSATTATSISPLHTQHNQVHFHVQVNTLRVRASKAPLFNRFPLLVFKKRRTLTNEISLTKSKRTVGLLPRFSMPITKMFTSFLAYELRSVSRSSLRYEFNLTGKFLGFFSVTTWPLLHNFLTNVYQR